jgi:two-component system chemotaxis sensor kinase CheA
MFLSDSKIMMQTLRRVVQDAQSGELTAEQVDRAFRAAHSLKSEAGFLDVNEISATAHELEGILSDVRESGGQIDAATHDRLLSALSLLDSKLNDYYASVAAGARSSGQPGDGGGGSDGSDAERQPLRPSNYQAQDATIAAALRTQGVRAILRESEQRGESFYRLEVNFLAPADLLYPRAFLIINNLEVSAVVVATEPAVEELSDQNRVLRLIVATSESEDQVKRRVHVDEVELTELTQISFRELFEQPSESDAEAISERRKQDPETLHSELQIVADHLVEEVQGLRAVSSGEAAASGSLERIERLASYLRNRATRRADVQLLDAARKIQKQAVQYAARQGKRVRVSFGGTGAPVSNVVSNVAVDALLHLIRNSIDHGILPLKERVRNGRPPAGSIRVEVNTRGELVRLKVSDDGVGVNEREVRAAAGAGADTDLVELLAQPGFTTKARATEASGRGVGLDAVLHTTKRLLRGSLSMRNRPGSGLTVTMSFPRRADLLAVLLVMHGRALFAIPTSVLLGSESLTVDLVKRDSFGSTYYQVDAQTIPVVTPSGRTPRLERFDKKAQLLLVRGMSGQLALAVDSLVGEETVVKDRENPNRVYSRLVDGEAQLLLPGLLID